MKPIFIILFSIVCGFCQGQDTYTITIKANNLSEDMAVTSSFDDELLLLIYTAKDSGYLNTPVVAEQTVLDTTNRTWELTTVLPTEKKLIIFLIELDMDQYIEQVDPVLRVYHQEIIALFEKHGDSELEKYLHRKDLLGYKYISLEGNKTQSFVLTGRHNLDKYEYKISLKK